MLKLWVTATVVLPLVIVAFPDFSVKYSSLNFIIVPVPSSVNKLPTPVIMFLFIIVFVVPAFLIYIPDHQ